MRGFGPKSNKNKALFASYIDVNSIKNSNKEFFLDADPSSGGDKMNQIEQENIVKLAERPDIFALMVRSVCPSIYGNELVKAGLVLCLFGGTDYRYKNKNDFGDFYYCKDNAGAEEEEEPGEERQHTIRPDIHVLMVGDPGLGKSQMLKHIINVAPRGVYVCGNSTTNAGLTATLIRDQSSNEANLEAGALVLSDLGVCCIDEFDKMSSD